MALINQTNGFNDASASFVDAAAANHLPGNLYVVCARQNGAGTVSSVTDTALNTYVQCTSARVVAGASAAFLDIWYNTTYKGNASNVVRVTFAGANTFNGILVGQYSLMNIANPFEIAVTGTVTSTTVTSGSFSPVAIRNVNVAVGTQTVGGGTWSLGSNYLNLLGSAGTNLGVSAFENRLDSPVGAQTASITYSLSSAMAISVASFRVAPPPGWPPERTNSVTAGPSYAI